MRRHHHHALLLLSGALLLGCPTPPGTGSSSSSSSGGGSSGNTASSGGGGSSGIVAGQPIPLENLCPALANGYLRAYVFYGYGLSLGLSGQSAVGCEPHLSDEDALVAFFGDVETARAELCAADGGLMMANVNAVNRAQTAGRLTYNPNAAGDCVAEGRGYFNTYGGLMRTIVASGRLDAGALASGQTVCSNVIVGHQQEGEPCLSPLECAASDGGMDCVHRLQADCMGVCQHLGRAGEPCETQGNPGCTGDHACIKPGDGKRGVCAAAVAPGQSCAVDGGELNCTSGTCTNGLCVVGSDGGTVGEGTGCTETAECQAGLVCANNPRRCVRRAAMGEVCDDGNMVDRPCEACLTCYARPDQDAGPDASVVRRCVASAGLDQPCTDAPCELGLVCLGGACRPLAKRGQACARPDFTTAERDESLRGNCLSPLDSCTGAPATCQPRVDVGQPCSTPAGFQAMQGNCKGGLTCLRSSASATQGTCAVTPNTPNAACGRRYDVPLDCDDTTAGVALSCSATWDGGQGVCYVDDNGQAGDLCKGDSDCATGLYCDGYTSSTPATPGRCLNGGPLGAPCGFSVDAGWRSTCFNGFCARGVCTALKSTGESCSGGSECANGLWCNRDAGCLTRGMAGATCEDDVQCAEGLECAPEGVCAAAECVNYSGGCGGCGGCTDGSYVPTLLFFGAVAQSWRWRRRARKAVQR